jgi:hypothetical protein
MNCQLSQRNMLLADSNELSARKIDELEEHLRTCRHCREYRKDLRRTVLAARNILCREEPNAATVSQIRSAAQNNLERKVLILFRPAFRLAACAALLALLAGGWFMLANDAKPGRISDVGAILAMLSEDELQDYLLTDEAGSELEMRAIADQLLIMEGFVSDGLSDFDPATLLQELPPTTLLLRSMPGLRST